MFEIYFYYFIIVPVIIFLFSHAAAVVGAVEAVVVFCCCCCCLRHHVHLCLQPVSFILYSVKGVESIGVCDKFCGGRSGACHGGGVLRVLAVVSLTVVIVMMLTDCQGAGLLQ